MTTSEANARFALRKLRSDEIVSIANAWLNDGIYSVSLGQLSTVVNPEMADVGPLFRTALQELGCVPLTRVEAAIMMTGIILQRIAKGEIDPVEGSEFLYWQVHHEISGDLPDTKYLGDNLGLEEVFCWLREIWDCRDGSMIPYHADLPGDQAERKFIEHLIEAAVKWKRKT